MNTASEASIRPRRSGSSEQQIDLINAQVSYRSVSTEYLSAVRDMYVALVALRQAMGDYAPEEDGTWREAVTRYGKGNNVLGEVGLNFAAGMSGGIAYVLDLEHTLYLRMNKDMVSMHEVTEKYDIAELKEILTDYEQETGSPYAARVLKHFREFLPSFKKIVPNDYQKMLTSISRYEEQGIPYENAVLEAFREVSSNG